MAKSCRPFLAFVALAAAFSSGCGRAGDSAPAGRKGGRSLPVRTAPVVARDVVYTVKALGSLEPDEMVQITAEVAGVAREVLFRRADLMGEMLILREFANHRGEQGCVINGSGANRKHRQGPG